VLTAFRRHGGWEIKQKRPRGARPRHPFPLRAPATDAAPRTPAESRALRLLAIDSPSSRLLRRLRGTTVYRRLQSLMLNHFLTPAPGACCFAQAPSRLRRALAWPCSALQSAPPLGGPLTRPTEPALSHHTCPQAAALHPQRGCHIASARSLRDILCSGHPHPLLPQGAIDPLIQAAAFCLLEGPLERLLHLPP